MLSKVQRNLFHICMREDNQKFVGGSQMKYNKVVSGLMVKSDSVEAINMVFNIDTLILESHKPLLYFSGCDIDVVSADPLLRWELDIIKEVVEAEDIKAVTTIDEKGIVSILIRYSGAEYAVMSSRKNAYVDRFRFGKDAKEYLKEPMSFMLDHGDIIVNTNGKERRELKVTLEVIDD